jgi:ATP-dependent Zn protease
MKRLCSVVMPLFALNVIHILILASTTMTITMNHSRFVNSGINSSFCNEGGDSSLLSDWERESVAIHEAGHTIVAWRLPHAHRVVEVSVRSRTDQGILGYTALEKVDGIALSTDKQVLS